MSSISVISGYSDNSVEEVRVAVADYNEGDVVFESIHGYAVLTPRDEEDLSVAEVPTDGSEVQAGVPAVPADGTTADEAAGELVDGQEEISVEEPTEGEADSSNDIVAQLSDDTEHVIGSSSEDLENIEEREAGSIYINTLETSGLTEDGSSVIINWQISAQLEDNILPAGAIIRVDTATGKMHTMSVEEAKAWAGTVSVGGEEVALCEDENYEVIFVGNNNLLYTWADVQAMY